jgi:hypothetical protein
MPAKGSGKGEKRARPEPPATRQPPAKRRQLRPADGNKEVLDAKNLLHAETEKSVCSHCGAMVSYETYVSYQSPHFLLWDDNKSEWSTTKGVYPKKPAEGYDADTIFYRLHPFHLAAEEKKKEKKKNQSKLSTQGVSHLSTRTTEGKETSSAPTPVMVKHELAGPPNESYDIETVTNDKITWSEDEFTDEEDEEEGEEEDDSYPGHDVADNLEPTGWQDVEPEVDDEQPEALPENAPLPREDREAIDPFWVLMNSWKSTYGMGDLGFDVLIDLLKTREGTLPPVIVVPEMDEDLQNKAFVELQKAAYKRATPTRHNVDAALGIGVDLFQTVCVCGECGRLYELEDIVRTSGNTTQAWSCCKQVPLARRVGGKVPRWEPTLSYPNVSVEESLAKILRRHGMDEQVDHWKARAQDKKDAQGPKTYSDVVDGKVWEDFQVVNGVPFLSDRGIALMLNMDGFQPYKWRTYSVQGIYLALMNLPRSIRFRRENMILVGLVPGGKERIPISWFLEKMVDELVVLWDTASSIFNRRVALLAVACDVPAGRKVCGFIGHSSHRGCSRCDCRHETTPRGKGKGPPIVDWGAPLGADEDGEFPHRTVDLHRLYGERYKKAKTEDERKQICSETGYRHTPLLRLSYFDPARMLLLDPLHNVWEGMFKDLLKIWVKHPNNELRCITKKMTQAMEAATKRCRFPRSMGPVLGKVAHNMSKFTGAELKNMLNTFFIWLIDGAPSVSDKHIQLVTHLHLASRILDARVTTESQISELEEHLKDYCTTFQKMYGASALKPNHHLCRHLGGFIRDYGTVAGFWLFHFERYNGIMVRSNARAFHNVEVSMFRQYSVQSSLLHSLESMVITVPPTLSPSPAESALTTSSTDIREQSNNKHRAPLTGLGLPALLSRAPTESEKGVALSIMGADDKSDRVHKLTLSRSTPTTTINAMRASQERWDHTNYSNVRGHELYPGVLSDPRERLCAGNEEIGRLRKSLAALHRTPGFTCVAPADFKIHDLRTYRSLHLGGVTYGSLDDRISHLVLNQAASQERVGSPVHVLYYLSVEVTLPARESFRGRENNDPDIVCDWDAGYTRLRHTFARVDWFGAVASQDKPYFQTWSTLPDNRGSDDYLFIPVNRVVSGCIPLLSPDEKTFVCGLLRPHHQF